MKSKVAILIAAAIITSVLAAGCTSNTNQSAQSTSSGTSHDAVLQAVISDDLQAYDSAQWVRALNQSVQWVNATTAMVTYKMSNPTKNLNYTANYTRLGSIAKASEYVSSISQGYNATSAAQLIGFPALATASSLNEHKYFLNVTQRLPSTNSYIKMERDSPTAPASYIIQVDDVVITFNATFNSAAS
jgi:outer membrane murein-binding lipoprotein Lpp